MSKKTIALIVVIILLVVIGAVIYFTSQNSNQTEGNNNQETLADQTEENNQVANDVVAEDNNTAENTETGSGKTLVVYFSAQGHTESVAQKIANNLGADIFKLVPTQEYTSADLDWTDSNSRVTQEYEDESLRNIALNSTTVENWDSYDTVLIGYPIWWGIVAWPVDTFVKVNDFTGKTVIPFCTSSSSGLGQSGDLLAQEAGTGTWLEGHRFSSNPSDSDIDAWTATIQ